MVHEMFDAFCKSIERNAWFRVLLIAATVLLLVSQQPERRLDWIAALCVTMLISAVVLVSAERILRVIGNRLAVAVERLMGLVLVSVAIEMMLRGAKTFALQLMKG
jgi:small neutral amino acid transporter SnatA (MarC family)